MLSSLSSFLTKNNVFHGNTLPGSSKKMNDRVGIICKYEYLDTALTKKAPPSTDQSTTQPKKKKRVRFEVSKEAPSLVSSTTSCDDVDDNKTFLSVETNSKAEHNVKFVGGCDGGDEKRKKPPIKVKILMTKEEAARLLSKCKDNSGALEFKDVARELVQIPINRVSFVSSSSFSNKRID